MDLNKAKKPKKGAGKTDAAPTSDDTKALIFEHGPALGIDIPIVAEGTELEAQYFSEPVMVSAKPEEHATFKDNKQLHTFHDAFMTLFNKEQANIIANQDGRTLATLTSHCNKLFGIG